MTRSQEEYVFNAFKGLYAEFPNGQFVRDEQPDYLINSNDKTIGVELTQIFIDNYLNSSLNEKRKESLQTMLGDKLCEKLQPIIPFRFLMTVGFSTKSFSQSDINQIVLACESYFKQIQFPKEGFTSLDVNNYGQLPDEIDSINFFRHPSIKQSSFNESAGGVLPDLTLQHLQIVLDKKHKALKKYKVCDEYWLLIEEGTFLSDSFGDIQIEEFKSDFQKVFLYRHSKGELIQLK